MATDDRCNLVKVYNGGSCSWKDFEAAMKVATRGAVASWAKVVWSTPPNEFEEDDLDALIALRLTGPLLLDFTEEELILSFDRKGGSEGAALALFNAIDKLRRGSSRACVTCSPACCAVHMSACCRAPCLSCICTFVL